MLHDINKIIIELVYVKLDRICRMGDGGAEQLSHVIVEGTLDNGPELHIGDGRSVTSILAILDARPYTFSMEM